MDNAPRASGKKEYQEGGGGGCEGRQADDDGVLKDRSATEVEEKAAEGDWRLTDTGDVHL